ncbi:hypothetical protein ACEPAI_3579 [Sanghuangporus weigelae]
MASEVPNGEANAVTENTFRLRAYNGAAHLVSSLVGLFNPNGSLFLSHSLLPSLSLYIKPGDPRDIFAGKIIFFRTKSEEEIRARWESRKVEVTYDCRLRHREAVKNAQRQGVQD